MPLLSVSHRQQRRHSDCLAACAAMILDYLHVRVKYSQLLSLLRIQAFGTSFNSLQNLEALGLSVHIGEGDIEQLREHLESGLPSVVFVDTGQLTSYWNEQTNHAVVVVGMEENQIYLNDPEFDSAPQLISMDEFLLAWEEKDYLYAVIGLAG